MLIQSAWLLWCLYGFYSSLLLPSVGGKALPQSQTPGLWVRKGSLQPTPMTSFSPGRLVFRGASTLSPVPMPLSCLLLLAGLFFDLEEEWVHLGHLLPSDQGLGDMEYEFLFTAGSVQFSHSVVSDSATPWTAALQASLFITNSLSLLKLMSIKSVMPSSHLILCCPLLLLPSIFPSIRVFSNESVLHIR